MIGARPSPTTRGSQRYGSGFHGSPVDARIRIDERSCSRDGLVAVRAKRADRAWARRRAPRSGAARRAPTAGPGRDSRARPPSSTSVAPAAPAPTTTHGPMIQPMSVTHITRSSAWTSAWNARLLGDLHQEARRARGRRPSAGPSSPTCRSPSWASRRRAPEARARGSGGRRASSQRWSRPAAIGTSVPSRSHDDDVPDGRRVGHRVVGDRLHRHRPPAPRHRVGGEERHRAGVGQAGGDGGGGEPREDRARRSRRSCSTA